MIPLKSEKQIKLYGQLLVNFANARNSDEAYKELIKGFQRAFNFSTNFVRQSEKAHRSLKEFKSALSESEMALIKTHFLEDDEVWIIDGLNEELESINRKLVDYNSTQKTFTFQEFEWDADHDGDMLHGFKDFSEPPYTISIGKIEQTMSVSEYKPGSWESIEPETINELKKLIKISRVKAKIIQKTSEERYSELKNLTKTYKDIKGIHERIYSYQNNLRTILNDIVEGENLYDNQTLNYYLDAYRSDCKLELTLQPDGSFNYDSKFLNEKKYLKYKDSVFDPTFGPTNYPPHCLPIAYSLIEFLLNYDRRKLKHCPYCNNFFIAKSINRKTRCYEPNCEKAYQRDKKRKQRKKEPDIYY
jgi:hypothetical protein